MLLAAVPETQPGGSAGADGIQALDGLVAVAQRICKRVEPRVEAVGRIGHKVGQDDDSRADGRRAADSRQYEPSQPRAAHEHQHRPDAQNEKRAGEVGFQQHQSRHHPQHQRKGQHPHRKLLHPVVVE